MTPPHRTIRVNEHGRITYDSMGRLDRPKACLPNNIETALRVLVESPEATERRFALMARIEELTGIPATAHWSF